MQEFIKLIRAYKHILTAQEFKTLKGQALSGDIEGANKGFQKILKRKTEIRKI